jgi:hypothetical protein
MREIGGYFKLEINETASSNNDKRVFLNSARSCLELVLHEKKIRKVYLPAYCCDAMLKPMTKLNIEYEFYDIGLDFKPVFEKELVKDELIIIVNYFGLFFNNDVSGFIGKGHVLIDNAQNYYGKSICHKNVYTVYSPRKFFGVIDGGILENYLTTRSDFNKCDESELIEILKPHLLRYEYGNNPDRYNLFRVKELKYYNEICSVSNLTKALLSAIDFERVKEKRISNFNYLHDNLNDKSLIPVNRLSDNKKVPMIYPFFIENNEEVYSKLINEKIYCPYYWREVLDRVGDFINSIKITRSLVALPIDQRYDIDDMQHILSQMEKCRKHYE